MYKTIPHIFWLMKVLAAGILSLIFLSLFSYTYRFTGIRSSDTFGATDYAWTPNQRMSTMTEGFSWVRVDGNGYNNAYASDGDIDILLMGSSHMEALNIGADKNVGYLLNELMADSYTYNIGISGHPLYRCVNNLEAAVDRFQPTEWVVMETDRVKFDAELMQRVIDGRFERSVSYNSGILYYIQKLIPGAKILFNQVSDWISMGSESNRMISDETEVSDYYIATLDAFLNKAVSSLGGQKLLIVYQPNTEIDTTGSYISTTEDEYSAIFRDRCEVARVGFLDLSETFKNLYNMEHILAHGFINNAVGKGHLNEVGHRVFAEEVANVIGKEE